MVLDLMLYYVECGDEFTNKLAILMVLFMIDCAASSDNLSIN